MRIMKIRNKLAPFLLGLSFARVLVGFGCSGGGSSEIEDLCEDFCDHSTTCGEVPDAQSLCVSECEDDFESAEELDGEECVEAQIVALTCAEGLVCPDLFEFLREDITATDIIPLFLGNLLCEVGLPHDCCEAELLGMLGACPVTFPAN